MTEMEKIIADMREIAKTNKFTRHVSRIINIADFIKEHEDVDDWYVISESKSDLMITPVKSPIADILRFSTETLVSYANQCTAGYIYYYDPNVEDKPETSISVKYVIHHLDIDDVRKFSEHIPKLLEGISLVLGQINDVDVLSGKTFSDDTYCMDFNVCELDNGVELSLEVDDTSRLSSMEIDVVLSFITFCAELSIGVSNTVNEIFRQLISNDKEPSIELIYKYMRFYGIR